MSLTTRTLALLSMLSVAACSAQAGDPPESTEPAESSEEALTAASLAGEYRATVDRKLFERDDSSNRWDYWELSIVDTGNGQCSYSARTVDIDCGTPCGRNDIDDPANQSVHEGACTVDQGGSSLTLLGTFGAKYDHVEVGFKVKRRSNGRLELTAKHDGVKQTFDKVGSAPKPRVRDFATVAGVAYARDGHDNNYASMFELSPGDNQTPRPQATQKALSTKADIQASLAKCVFISNGAYGQHISSSKQASLAAKLAGQIFGVRSPQTKYFEIGNASNTGDIITSGCVFRMEEGGYRLELDGASFD